jgi:hypothetical protein
VRSCPPDPQLAEQVSKADQADVKQSTGHGSVLHTWDAFSGHSSPPCCDSARTFTGRIWTPLPHDLVQEVQGMYSWLQCKGQGYVLQF